MDALNTVGNLLVGGAAQVGAPSGSQAAGAAGGDGQVSFKDVLMKNLGEVNQLQQDADTALENYVSGKTQNLGEVISAGQKASLAFSMLTQIRNKLQDAYDEVKNLRI